MLVAILCIFWVAGSIAASISQSNHASSQWSNRTYPTSATAPQNGQLALWSEKLSWTIAPSSSSAPGGWIVKRTTGSSVDSFVTSLRSAVVSYPLDSVTEMPTLSDNLSYKSVAVSDTKTSLSRDITSSSLSWSPAISNIVSKVTASVAGLPFTQSSQSVRSTTTNPDSTLSPTSEDDSIRSPSGGLPTVSCIACSDDPERGSGGSFSTNLSGTASPPSLLESYEKTAIPMIPMDSVQRTFTATISSHSSRIQWSSQPTYLQDPAVITVYPLAWQATVAQFSTERVPTTPIVRLDAPYLTTSSSGSESRSHSPTDTRNDGLTMSTVPLTPHSSSSSSSSSTEATGSGLLSTTTTSTNDATQTSEPGTAQDDGASRSYRPSGKSAGIAVGAAVSVVGVGVVIYCLHPKRRQRRKKGTIWIGYSHR